MSRTNDVNIAMQYAKSGVDGVHLMDSHKATIGWVVNTLAAEVERLEAEHIEAMAAITAVSRAAGQERTRAETAEALLKQTEDIAARRSQSCATMLARAEAAEAQNARLRAALEGVSLLAHCISKAGPLNTPDLETAWRKFDLISVKAAEALVDRKAALNGEEANK